MSPQSFDHTLGLFDDNRIAVEEVFYLAVANTIFYAFINDVPFRAGVAFGEVYVDSAALGASLC